MAEDQSVTGAAEATNASPPSNKQRRLRMLIGVLVLLLVGWWTFLFSIQGHLIWPIGLVGPLQELKPSPNVQVLTRDIGEGEMVEAWYVPAGDLSAGASVMPLVVYLHGNGELIDYQDRILNQYHAMGLSVLLVEYRGYGRSGGKPTQWNIREDVLHFIDQVPHEKLIYHGRSLGGGVSADLATVLTPDAVILESTFRSIASMARKYFALPFLIRHPYRTDRALGDSDWPVLLFHGSDDSIIPLSESQKLAELRTDAKLVVYPAGHNDFPGPDHEQDYWHEIRTFLTAQKLLPSDAE